MPGNRVVIIGAGMGGLAAGVDLARRGADVTIIERAASPGGKVRELEVCGRRLDAGPTVLTMRWILESLFSDAGTSLDRHLALDPIDVLARHFWNDGAQLDLFADAQRSADAIGTFAGAEEARGYLAFSRRAAEVFGTLDEPFMRSGSHGLLSLIRGIGVRRPGALLAIAPFSTLEQELRRYFRDPRLRQLFGRYATYCGSSPYQSPATLMLIAHAERMGVWSVRGGMYRIAEVLAAVAAGLGVTFRYQTHVDEIDVRYGRACSVRCADGTQVDADAIVMNGDVSALGSGRLGSDIAQAVDATQRTARSFSAITWAMVADTNAFALQRHNVFFSTDDDAEFQHLRVHSRVSSEPTVYVCAQDRDSQGALKSKGAERLFSIINAPAEGDRGALPSKEFERCERAAFQRLAQFGLRLEATSVTRQATTPADFENLYPGTGGALYGPASHGWQSAFRRSGARSRIPGLYLAGGSVHPGPGVPMAVLSGRLAASRILADLASTRRSTRGAMPGGTSMH